MSCCPKNWRVTALHPQSDPETSPVAKCVDRGRPAFHQGPTRLQTGVFPMESMTPALWIEAIGWLASGLTVLTYAMNTMLLLRIFAVSSTVFFLIYGTILHIRPLAGMDAVPRSITQRLIARDAAQATPQRIADQGQTPGAYRG